MRFLLAAALAFALPAMAEIPTLTSASDDGVTVKAPEGWKTMIDGPTADILVSRDAFTTMKIQWFPHPADNDAALDKALDILLKVTNDNLPVGSATEKSRVMVEGQHTKYAIAEYSNMFGQTMQLTFVARLDKKTKRLVTGVFLTDPESFAKLSGDQLAVQMVLSVTGGPRGPEKKAAE